MRSEFRSASNCAIVPNTAKTSPSACGGGVDRLGQRGQLAAALVQLQPQLDQVAQVARQAVELPHREGVAGAQELQRRGQLGPLGALAGAAVGEDPLAAALLQGPQLLGGVLVDGGDAAVADEQARTLLTLHVTKGHCERIFGAVSGDDRRGSRGAAGVFAKGSFQGRGVGRGPGAGGGFCLGGGGVCRGGYKVSLWHLRSPVRPTVHKTILSQNYRPRQASSRMRILAAILASMRSPGWPFAPIANRLRRKVPNALASGSSIRQGAIYESRRNREEACQCRRCRDHCRDKDPEPRGNVFGTRPVVAITRYSSGGHPYNPARVPLLERTPDPDD